MCNVVSLASRAVCVVVHDDAAGATKNSDGREGMPLRTMEAVDRLRNSVYMKAQRIEGNVQMVGEPPGAERGVVLKAEFSAVLRRVLFRLGLEPPPQWWTGHRLPRRLWPDHASPG